MPNPLDIPKSSFGGSSAATVTQAAPGAGIRNFLADLTIKSNAAYNITIESPSGTTIFRVRNLRANEGYEKSWARGLRGAENAAMIITVSAGTYDTNYQGVTA